MAVAGLAVAPLFVVLYLGTDELAAPQHRAEASTWINTGNNIGFALGSALAGVVVDDGPPSTAFAVGAAALLIGIVVVALSGSRLQAETSDGPR
jgi:predicted MFS family arabinose efflux permease